MDTGLELPAAEEPDELRRFDRQTLQMSGGFPHPVLTPEEIFRTQEAREKISEVMLSLNSRERQVVIRCVVEDENIEDIGSTLNLSEERIKQILFKALRKLRQASGALREFRDLVN